MTVTADRQQANRMEQERTYGHWREGRRPGLFGLGPAATAAGFMVLVFAVLLMPLSLWASATVMVTGFLVLLPAALRSQGRTGWHMLAARFAWWRGRRRRHHLYLSGAASPVTGSHQLPGILARSTVYEVETGRGGLNARVGVVVIPQARHYSVTLRAQTDGLDLVDQHEVDARVARYAAWLSLLGREPLLVQAQITVETTPDPGTRLSEWVATSTVAEAPALSREVLDEIVATYPTGSAAVDTRVTLTFAPPRTGKASMWTPEVMCREVAARLPVLHAGLIGTGVSAARPMTASELAVCMRAAYDPATAAVLSQARVADLDWTQVGPVGAQEASDHYRHDSGVSITWGMVEAPRGVTYASTFARLTDPDPQLLRKRVSLVYRPYAPAEAAKLVESDRRDAGFTANKKRRATKRDEVDILAAEQAADEEARGAGVTRFTVLVTATLPARAAQADLDDAERRLLARAAEARLSLRRMTFAQAAGFSAGLPAGVVLPVHATIPF